MPEEAEKLGDPEMVARLFCFSRQPIKGDKMQLYGGINPYASQSFGFGYIDTIQRQRDVTASFKGLPVSNHRDQMDDTTRHVLRMRKAMEAVKQLMPASSESTEIEVSIAAGATSASSLSLSSGGAATPTTLQSTEEVNAETSTDYTDPSAWTGASTSQATISGEYDGSNGTDTLRFEVARGGTRGGKANLQVKVYDSNNTEIDKIDIRKSDSIDKQYTMNNGLVVTFGAGDLVQNDTFTMEVYDNIEAAVDPDKPFNGTGSDDPNFQSGLDVTSGSFQVNGTTIDVLADDTLNTVLDKINQSDAGVTATFDAATETVLLTQDTPGSTQDIALSNDTSGFVAAVKLDSAVAIPGNDAESEKTLAAEGQFASVQSGSISVNGTSIDIDVNTDTLTDVLDRITASAAEVTASFDSASQKVSLTSDGTDSQLILDSGTTNFFSAVEISDGTYDPVNESIEVQTEGVDVVNASDLAAEYADTYNTELGATVRADQDVAPAPISADTKMLSKLVDIIADSMNALFDDSAITSSPGAGTEALRDELRSAVTSWFDSEGPQFDTDFGIGFDFEKTEESVFKFSQADRSRFEDALASPQSAAAVHSALFGTESDGLFNQLHSVLTAAGSESDSDPTGLFVNLSI
ncbi:MAG: hypothetical protein OET63_00795 [Desulfobacterales bacterium]|nr:hypothetical protein [Desulfobacterales bacterium]